MWDPPATSRKTSLISSGVPRTRRAEGKLAAVFSRPRQEFVGFPRRFLAPPAGISGLPTTGSNGAHGAGRLKHSRFHLLAEALMLKHSRFHLQFVP
jgi:hypothetical protein